MLSLYRCDLIIQRAAFASIFGILVAMGMQWATLPTPSGQEPTFEAMVGPKVSVAGLVVSAIALVVLTRRYLLVKKILGQGATIKGRVGDIDVYETRKKIETTGEYSVTRNHYAHVTYSFQGADRTVRLRLPSFPSVYGICKGNDVDLLVLDSAPKKPLIRSVYFAAENQRPLRFFF